MTSAISYSDSLESQSVNAFTRKNCDRDMWLMMSSLGVLALDPNFSYKCQNQLKFKIPKGSTPVRPCQLFSNHFNSFCTVARECKNS